jgi:hypothetical protein
MTNTKYVKTKDDDIIVFSETMQHSQFKHWNPVSAGFIMFYIDKETGNPNCKCYGESISLGLKSNPEEDTARARYQLGLRDY